MKRCTRVGIDVTKKCNASCLHCFYRHKADFNSDYHRPLHDVIRETKEGKMRGCDHVVLVGWGEPGLWPNLIEFIKQVKEIGMTSSVITNGTLAVRHYAAMREAGLNHLHISVHGVGDTLDEIIGIPGAARKQQELFTYLKSEDWPWRMNMTVQQKNYKELQDITAMCLHYRCRHIISLGFLPHYEWNDPAKCKEIAVHPEILMIELAKVGETIISHNEYAKHGYKAMFTIRYHPMCKLPEQMRKYVVNARYVLHDPWEWDYCSAHMSDDQFEQAALQIGNSVANREYPCNQCGLQVHCGGWNKIYADAFNGANLQPIEMPRETQIAGWLHDQNPANLEKGWFE